MGVGSGYARKAMGEGSSNGFAKLVDLWINNVTARGILSSKHL